MTSPQLIKDAGKHTIMLREIETFFGKLSRPNGKLGVCDGSERDGSERHAPGPDPFTSGAYCFDDDHAGSRRCFSCDIE